MKVTFHPTKVNSSWWYVVPMSSRSRQIFDDHGMEENSENISIHDMEEENTENINIHDMEEAIPMDVNNQEHHIMPSTTRQCLSRWKSLIQCLQAQIDEEPGVHHYETTSGDEHGYTTDTSDQDDTISTSLGINLEVVLEIDRGDMVMDDVSMPEF